MTLLEQAAETAAELGITQREALVLEFLASRAWALVKRDNPAAAVMHIGAAHAAGVIDADTMRQCLALVRREGGDNK